MTDDEQPAAQTLRTMITGLDVPPSAVDIDLAVRTGRRRERRRTAAWTVSVAAALTGVVWVAPLGFGVVHTPAPVTTDHVAPDRRGPDRRGPDRPLPSPPDVDLTEVSCTMTQLATPPGHSSTRLYAADKTGRYLVGTAFHDGRKKIRSAIWTDGVPQALDVPGIGAIREEYPTDVNSAGLVVGTATTAPMSSPSFAWTYRNGTGRALPTPDGYSIGGTVVVNERGDVAAAASGPGNGAVIVWPANRPDRPRVMPAPARPEVGDIADDGTVVGLISTQMPGVLNDGRPYVWSPDGTGRPLTVPAGWDGGTLVGAAAGYVVGSVHGKPASPPTAGEQLPLVGRWAAARWQLSTGAVEVGQPIEANDGGAGIYAATESGWLSLNVPALEQEGSVLAAPEGALWRLVTTTGPGLIGYMIYWISGDGRTVVGDAALKTGGTVPARWRCAPPLR